MEIFLFLQVSLKMPVCVIWTEVNDKAKYLQVSCAIVCVDQMELLCTLSPS